MNTYYCRVCKKNVKTYDHHCPVCRNLLTRNRGRGGVVSSQSGSRSSQANHRSRVALQDVQQNSESPVNIDTREEEKEHCGINHFIGPCSDDGKSSCVWILSKNEPWEVKTVETVMTLISSDLQSEESDDIMVSQISNIIFVKIMFEKKGKKCAGCIRFRKELEEEYLFNRPFEVCPISKLEHVDGQGRELIWLCGGLGAIKGERPGIYYLGSKNSKEIECKWGIEIPNIFNDGHIRKIEQLTRDEIKVSNSSIVINELPPKDEDIRYIITITGKGHDARCAWCKRFRREIIDYFQFKFRKRYFIDGYCRYDHNID
jgi:hypothetical protein